MLHVAVALALAGQSASTQQAVDAMHAPVPTLAPGQNFSPVPQLQVLAVQTAVPPQSAVTLQQCEPVSGCLAVYVHVALLHVGAFWQPLAAAQSPATLHWQPDDAL